MTRLYNGETLKATTAVPRPTIKGLRILIIAWGELHLNYLHQALLPSLKQPKNREALNGAVVEFHSTDEIDLGLGLPVDFYPTENKEKYGVVQQDIMAACLRRAANTGDRVLLAPPDTFFGEETIPNLLAANDPGTVVGFTHPRVIDTEFLSYIPQSPEIWTNPELVFRAVRCLHPSFSEAIEGSNSFYSGVLLKNLGNMWVVHHRIPTPYLVHPIKPDADQLLSYSVHGAWDHLWPEVLLKQGRWRLVGSSDLCFAVELTPEGKNIPPKTKVDPNEPDRYRGILGHHQSNRSFLSVWREK